jgi:hypothetical protein
VDKEIGPQILAAFSSVVRKIRALETPGEATGDVPSSVIAVLGLLSDNGELRLGAVAASLGVDTSVISRTVAVAVHRGLVSRRPDPRDGRACLFSRRAGRPGPDDVTRHAVLRHALVLALPLPWGCHRGPRSLAISEERQTENPGGRAGQRRTRGDHRGCDGSSTSVRRQNARHGQLTASRY